MAKPFRSLVGVGGRSVPKVPLPNVTWFLTGFRAIFLDLMPRTTIKWKKTRNMLKKRWRAFNPAKSNYSSPGGR